MRRFKIECPAIKTKRDHRAQRKQPVARIFVKETVGTTARPAAQAEIDLFAIAGRRIEVKAKPKRDTPKGGGEVVIKRCDTGDQIMIRFKDQDGAARVLARREGGAQPCAGQVPGQQQRPFNPCERQAGFAHQRRQHRCHTVPDAGRQAAGVHLFDHAINDQ